MTKAKSKIKQRKIGFQTPKKPARRLPVYTKPNLHQPIGFADDLRGALKAITITEAAMLAEIMNVHAQELMTQAGIKMDIQDIECYEGGVKNAADSFDYWFHAGPATTMGDDKNKYVLIKSNVLNWLLDCIMFRMSYDGYKILTKLGIPL